MLFKNSTIKHLYLCYKNKKTNYSEVSKLKYIEPEFSVMGFDFGDVICESSEVIGDDNVINYFDEWEN